MAIRNADVLLFFLFIIIKCHPLLSLTDEIPPGTCYDVTITAKSVFDPQNKEPKDVHDRIKIILSTAYDAPIMTCDNAVIVFKDKNFRNNRTANIAQFVLTYRINPQNKSEKVEAYICGENALYRASKNFTQLRDLLTFSEETKRNLSIEIEKRSCCYKKRYTVKNGSCVFFDKIDKPNEKGEVIEMENERNKKCKKCGPLLPLGLIIAVVVSIIFVVAVILAAMNVWRQKNRSGGDVEETAISANAEESINAAAEEINTAAAECLGNLTVTGYEIMNTNSFSTNLTESTVCSRASSVNDREKRPMSHTEMMFDFDKHIPKSAIMFTGTLLGSGQFGRVELANVTINGRTEKCAVKMIRGRGTNEDEKELFHELELLYQIPNHQNVVSLLGGCMEIDAPLYVVVEYCVKGNLLNYIKKMKHCKEYVNLTTPKLGLCWKITRALEICKGMIFLANNQIIHRDLAARNILLNENDVAKISDFGMAKDVYLRGLYIKETAGFLPIRWMAIEAIESSIYTIKSDMWSFGILLWELHMDGQSPYPELSDANELLDYLKRGYRMAKAENCPDALYQLMQICWLRKPDDRPPFSQALRELKNIKHIETKRESGISEESDNSDELPVFEEPEEHQAYGDKTFTGNKNTAVGFVNYGQSSNGDIELTEMKNLSHETTTL